MPASVAELIALLDLEVIEDNLFRGQQPETHMQRVFGGQVAAHALVAAARTVDPAFRVHSLHSYFLHPGDTSVPIVYDVNEIRDGRSFVTRQVRARQHGRPIFVLAANFQRDEVGYEHQDPTPDVPAPDQCPTLAQARGDGDRLEDWKREWDALDVRFAGTTETGEIERDGLVVSRSRLWIRINGELPDNPVLHAAALTYASDLTLLSATLVPHGQHTESGKVQAASLDHAMWFHRPMRADEWWLYDQTSPSASGGRGLGLARVFTESGALAATVAQEGLIRPLQRS